MLLPLLTLATVLISVGVGLESQVLVEHATLSGLPTFYVAVFRMSALSYCCVFSQVDVVLVYFCVSCPTAVLLDPAGLN